MSVCRCSLSTQEDIGRLHLTLWNISLEPYLFQASAWLPLFVCLFWTPKDVHCMMWIHKHVRIFGPEVRHAKGLQDSAVVSSGNDFISDVFQHCRKTAQIHAPSQVDPMKSSRHNLLWFFSLFTVFLHAPHFAMPRQLLLSRLPACMQG